MIHRGTFSRRSLLQLGAASLLPGALPALAQQRGDTFKIGSARAMTGLVASSFAPLYVGLKIAIDEVNAAGGIMGRQVELIEADDESSPAKEPAVVRKLLDGGAMVIVGPVGSSHALSAVATTGPAKVIHASGGFTEELADGAKYPYHYQFTYNAGQQGELVARFALDTLKLKKVGVLHEMTGFGESATASTVRNLKKRGVEPVAVEAYPLNATDMKVYVNKLRSAGAEVVVLWNAAAQGMVLTAAALQSMKWYPPLLGGNGMYSNTVQTSADPEVLKNAYATLLRTMTYSATEPPAPRQVAYVKKVLTYPEAKTWEINAAISPFYDFVHLLKRTVDAERKYDSESVKKAFDATRNYAGMIGPISFTPENHCAVDVDALVMVKVASGKDAQSLGVFRERV
ncbi:MAG TPA: ABC transporter substrate-binding protein [Rubrivivax sp.]|nr:ABC transporter substrate-binding protein [Rubrivivax sp.]